MEGRWVGGGESQDKHCVVFFFFFYSPASLGAVDNSLSGNQMLIKRKLHSIGWGQQHRKETPPPLPSEGRPTGEVEGDADRKAIATHQKTRTSEKETWQISIRSQGISLQRRG